MTYPNVKVPDGGFPSVTETDVSGHPIEPESLADGEALVSALQRAMAHFQMPVNNEAQTVAAATKTAQTLLVVLGAVEPDLSSG